MLDNQLYAMLKPILVNGMAALGYTVDFAQANQPTQQGLNKNPTFYCTKIPGDRLVGSPKTEYDWATETLSLFSGSITGNILTVERVQSGQLGANQSITGHGIPQNTFITKFDTGTGGVGTYVLNQSLTVARQNMSTIGGEVTTQTQQYESTFQINCLSTQNPAVTTQATPSDLLNFVAAILQSQATVAQLEAQGVGILKIGQVRNVYFKDDRDRFESSPSFDFSLTHKQVIVTAVPVITTTEVNILRV